MCASENMQHNYVRDWCELGWECLVGRSVSRSVGRGSVNLCVRIIPTAVAVMRLPMFPSNA